MTEPTDWIARAEEAGVSLRDSIREGHQLLRDLRDTRKELVQLQRELMQAIEVLIPDKVGETFRNVNRDALEQYVTHLEEMADEAIEAVSKGARDTFREHMAAMQSHFEGMIDELRTRLAADGKE